MELELLTFEDVAKIFHKNKKGIKNWLQNGILPRSITIKVGRNVYFVASKVGDHFEQLLLKNKGA